MYNKDELQEALDAVMNGDYTSFTAQDKAYVERLEMRIQALEQKLKQVMELLAL